jgi:hypothetical protein
MSCALVLQMKEFLVRLMYVEMLGHDASFGYIKAIELTASQNQCSVPQPGARVQVHACQPAAAGPGQVSAPLALKHHSAKQPSAQEQAHSTCCECGD